MNRLAWFVLIWAGSGCEALPFEASYLGTKPNPEYCDQEFNQCPSGKVCDFLTNECQSTEVCSPETGIGCRTESAPVCSSMGRCVSCNSMDPALGDRQCQTWADDQQNQKKVCLAGTCKECRDNSHCTPGSVCDQRRNVCAQCATDADCASVGSRICRSDESVLGTGEPLTKIGECVADTDVAYVKNAASCNDTAAQAGTMAVPYCQIQAAIDKGKSYIRVLGGGGDYDPIQVMANSQQRVIIYGPGKDNAAIRSAAVANAARLTLQDIAIRQTEPLGAVRCDNDSRLTLRRISINGSGNAFYGVRTENCSQVTIERVKVDRINGPGIWIIGGSEHRVVNNVIIRVGSINIGRRGGLYIGAGVSNGVFAFNTITNSIGGVLCESNQWITDSIVQDNLPDPPVMGCSTARVVTTGAMLMDSMSGADPRITGDSMTMPVVVDKGMQLPANVPPVTEDYYGNPRPAGGGLDIGFHEFR
jgi:hypothetical protein